MIRFNTLAGDPKDRECRHRPYRFISFIGHRHSTVALAIIINILIFAFGLIYYRSDTLVAQSSKHSIALSIGYAATVILHFDVALILFPVCHTLISMLRATSFSAFPQRGNGPTYHNILAWSMALFAWVHAIAHWINYAHVANENGWGIKGVFLLSLATGAGWSGHVMLVLLTLIAITSTESVRVGKPDMLHAFHHMSVVIFMLWSVHGAFKTTNARNSVSWTNVATFWQYWIGGGFAYLLERILQEFHGRHRAHISKVIQHPSGVIEMQIKKRAVVIQVGQGCPYHR